MDHGDPDQRTAASKHRSAGTIYSTLSGAGASFRINLATRINAARSAVGDDGESQRLIRTLPRKGIRFVGDVREDAIKTEQSPIAFNRPAIAVLPFQNMSGDPEQEYFADGTVDEIITGLSRIKWLLVTSRNSSFVYKSRPFTVKEVAEKHHVRYVLEGGVRKSGNRVRISAQLIDATTDSHLWAEQYDRLLDDVFALQDEIAMRVIGAIEPSLRRVEMERVKRQRPENLDDRQPREANSQALFQTASQ